MSYLILKSLHIAAAMTFVGGLLASGLFLSVVAYSKDLLVQPFAARLNTWNSYVTTPAMLVVWTIGVTLATHGGWLSFTWLHMKLPLVIALSALHGLQSTSVRKLMREQTEDIKQIRFAPAFVMAASVLIALLATLKPF